VHEGLDFVIHFTLIISAVVVVLVAITAAIFLYVRRRSRSAD
jgi:heme/copper-type cytochrome/quinol oxidase subunit 2